MSVVTFNQLNCFEAVCSTMSFSKAANRLYVSQPAISKSVSKLEEELGTKLFTQSAGSLSLTPAGELLREFVARLRQEQEQLSERLEELKSSRGLTLRLGCPETWNPAFFAGRMEACFAAADPGGKLTIEATRLSELLQRLQAGELDAVVSHDFYTPNIPGLRSMTLTETGTGLLYAPGHFPDPPEPRELAEAGFLLYDRDIEKRFGALIQSVCAPRGVEVHISGMGELSRALFEVSRGTGVMLFTDWDLVISNSAYRYFPLPDRLPVKLLYFPDRGSPLLRRFLEAAQSIDWM